MTEKKVWHTKEWKENKKEFLKKYPKCLQCGSGDKVTPHHFKKGEDRETYISLKNAIPLCKKCHFTTHKGMVLCKICWERYKKIGYPTCYTCRLRIDPKFKEEREFADISQEDIEKEIAEFEKEMEDEQEEAYDNWICKDCKFLEFEDLSDYGEVDLYGECTHSKCSNKLNEIGRVPFPLEEQPPNSPEAKQECEFYSKKN